MIPPVLAQLETGIRHTLASSNPSSTAARQPVRWWGALFLVLTPIFLLFAAVRWLGVNTVIADEFY
jgi:hypothetical protein